MIWLLIFFWMFAMVLACWHKAFLFFSKQKLLSIILMEAGLILFCRLHDGAWPVAALGGVSGVICYVWQREKALDVRERLASRKD